MLARAPGHDPPQTARVARARDDRGGAELGRHPRHRVGRVAIGDGKRLGSDPAAEPRQRRLGLRAQRAHGPPPLPS
jgi:hypothetical protein